MEHRHITQAVIANRSNLENRITQAKSLDPNRSPEEWALANKTGKDGLLDALGLRPEAGNGDSWRYLTQLVRKVWVGEPITDLPIANVIPIDVTPVDSKPVNVPVAQPATAFEFTPLDIPAASEPQQETEVFEGTKPISLDQLDAEKPETWEPLLDEWTIEQFSDLCREVLESVSSEELARSIMAMLQEFSEFDEDHKANLGPLKQFFSTVSTGLLWAALDQHLAVLQKEHKLGHSATEVAQWNEDYFFFLANNIQQNARTMSGLQPGLKNDPDAMTAMAMENLKNWHDHIDYERHPESWGMYFALAEYRIANETQFEQKMREIFDRLIATN
jgi:hypothetical protein